MLLVQPTLPAAGKRAPKAGNLGHITRISNKLIQLGSINSHIQNYLQVGRCFFAPFALVSKRYFIIKDLV